ncbi:helicase associated domain-containing protein [Streptomyces vinaceus]|uniref:helicase associated domain-containing protein n=1 Tax=Streptomyces vinaceus TaxID=1960 RepID=UPI0035D9F7EA
MNLLGTGSRIPRQIPGRKYGRAPAALPHHAAGHAPATKRSTTTSARGAAAFEAGVQALTQYLAREGGGASGRAHVERLPDGSEHRTGVWLANQRQRRDRLDADQLAALADLGVEWAR